MEPEGREVGQAFILEDISGLHLAPMGIVGLLRVR
jgi:hypothetical protein